MQIAEAVQENPHLALRPRAPHLTSTYLQKKGKSTSVNTQRRRNRRSLSHRQNPMEGAFEAITPQAVAAAIKEARNWNAAGPYQIYYKLDKIFSGNKPCQLCTKA
jgi:hypothetical protein